MFDLTGLTALVTGGGRGIGLATARALHAQGATLIIHGTNAERLSRAAEELGGARTIVANLLDQDAAQKIADEAGPVDILVNNAGITQDALFVRQTQEQWNQVLFVDLEQIVRLTRLVLPEMQKKGFGRIINTTSIVAHAGNIGQTNYITAKAGLTGFTKSLAKEAARKGVTVNAIAPGFIATDMTDVIPENLKEAFVKQIPAQRFGNPDEIAAAAVFLASREAGYVTGTTLHVNGGMYVGG